MQSFSTVNCCDCLFFEPGATGDEGVGWCQKNAPVGVLVEDDDGKEVVATFPTIHESNWCGEGVLDAVKVELRFKND